MNNKIFGYDFEDIQAMQKKRYVDKSIPLGDTRPRATEADIKMLNELGLEKLKEMEFYGVIDRLQTSGLLLNKGEKEKEKE